MGRRQRQRIKPAPSATEYRGADGSVLTLRASLPPAARREYQDVLAGGLEREDAWQRALELLFERLVISWSIADLEIKRQKELLGRFRMASEAERRFVRDCLRIHLAEHFPELRAP